MHILLVEDARENQIVIKSYLKKTPHVLTVTENGQEACEAFMAGRFDLVLMDMQMPVMDGYAATRTIREWENEQSRAPTPIIALTAHAFQEDRHKCIEAGCTEYLSKPVKKKTLLDMLDSVCGEDGLGVSA